MNVPRFTEVKTTMSRHKKQPTSEFYTLDRILQKNCIYNMIIGERSNGKTFSVHEYILTRYVKYNEQAGLIRRWEEEVKGKRAQETFASVVNEGVVTRLTDGQWTGITYYSGKWYLSKYDQELEKNVRSDEPFCYAFALTTAAHDKSTSYPNIKTILFDEFMTREGYLPDEFMKLMNLLSTIIRRRDDVKIFMLANTVNKYCPYFDEMGLRKVATQQMGTIDVYKFGQEGKTTVAVEYCGESIKTQKKSDVYFAFDNPKLQMITTGAWEIALYPHLTMKYDPENVRLHYFIDFDNNLLHCEIVSKDGTTFTYVHRKTTPIRYENRDIIYSTRYDMRLNHKRRITQPKTPVEKIIYRYYQMDKVFYQDNEVGEVVRNFLMWSQTDRGII